MAAVALGRDFEFKTTRQEVCPSGIAAVDSLAGGLPLGCLTEIFGPACSGRTSLMLAALAQSTSSENICALVDTKLNAAATLRVNYISLTQRGVHTCACHSKPPFNMLHGALFSSLDCDLPVPPLASSRSAISLTFDLPCS